MKRQQTILNQQIEKLEMDVVVATGDAPWEPSEMALSVQHEADVAGYNNYIEDLVAFTFPTEAELVERGDIEWHEGMLSWSERRAIADADRLYIPDMCCNCLECEGTTCECPHCGGYCCGEDALCGMLSRHYIDGY